MVKFVGNNPDRKFVHLGDLVEAITTDDKRYHSDSAKEPIPMKQMREAIEIFRPISKQTIVALRGNHELKLHRFGNLVEDLFCVELGIPYGTMTARIILMNDDRVLFKVFVTHDVPMFRSRAKDFLQRQANILAALKMSIQYRMGDCAVMICGHAHQLLSIAPSPMLYLTDSEKGVKQHYLQGDTGNGGYINPDQRYYGCAGSFRKKYMDGIDDYSDVYDPVEMGYLVLTIKGGRPISLDKKVA